MAALDGRTFVVGGCVSRHLAAATHLAGQRRLAALALRRLAVGAAALLAAPPHRPHSMPSLQ